ncbi:GGDEF domain-containing protein [Larkinella punicea]|uniref:diguanylate cyclase n=1 Tax=Larkinella punicea TaxID=2315727 RepID=A0A368JWB5_9BACT|nr:diguanylate cyclase [Larkinella punicea]RCR71246.1 GGDEF domain-containing protein [Larkinella punicea]
MNKKRIYDVIGAVIATLIATAITNKWDKFISFINSEISIPLYFILLIVIVAVFMSFLISNGLLIRKYEKKIKNIESERALKIDSLKEELIEIKSKYIELEKVSAIDDLTNAFNSNQINIFLEEKITDSNKMNKTFSVILIDIDNFKRINDNHGHEVGNLILKQISDLIRPRSKDDIFIRYGGDEFLILSKIGDTIQNGYGYAERIRKEVNDYQFLINYEQMGKENLSISCGVTDFKPGLDSKETVKARVDSALNKAKSKKADGSEKNFVQVLDR